MISAFNFITATLLSAESAFITVLNLSSATTRASMPATFLSILAFVALSSLHALSKKRRHAAIGSPH